MEVRESQHGLVGGNLTAHLIPTPAMGWINYFPLDQVAPSPILLFLHKMRKIISFPSESASGTRGCVRDTLSSSEQSELCNLATNTLNLSGGIVPD